MDNSKKKKKKRKKLVWRSSESHKRGWCGRIGLVDGDLSGVC